MMAMAILRSRLAASILACFVLCYVLGVIYLPRTLFLEFLNGMLGVLSLVVSLVYSLDIPTRLRSGHEGVVLIRIGIVLGWSNAWLQAFSRLYFFEMRPEVQGRTFDGLVGAPAVLLIVAAALHLIAIGLDQHGHVRLRRNLCLVMWSLGAGAALVVAIKLMRT